MGRNTKSLTSTLSLPSRDSLVTPGAPDTPEGHFNRKKLNSHIKSTKGREAHSSSLFLSLKIRKRGICRLFCMWEGEVVCAQLWGTDFLLPLEWLDRWLRWTEGRRPGSGAGHSLPRLCLRAWGGKAMRTARKSRGCGLCGVTAQPRLCWATLSLALQRPSGACSQGSDRHG